MRRPRTLLHLEPLEARELLSANYFPDTSSSIALFSDQLNSGLSNQLVQFISSHFDGTQKMLASENARYVADNPNWTLLSYRLATASGPASYIINGQWGSDWNTVTQNESWFMHNSSGQRLHNSQWNWDLNDISNPQWQQYWINSEISNMRADGAQGVFADSFTAGIGGGFTVDDPRFDGTNAANPSAWANGVDWVQQQQNLINTVEAAFAATPEQFKYIPNLDALVTGWYNLDTSKLDGAFLENFGEWGPPYLNGSPSDWVLSMNRALSMTSAGKDVIMQPYLENAPDSTNGLLQRGFDLGTYLLIKGDHTYLNLVAGGSSSGAYYYPEDGINLGQAVTPLPTDVSNYLWDGVYRRDFQNGVVLVNPGDSSITVDMGKTYQRANFSGGGALTDASLDANGNYIGGTLSYSAVQTITLAPGESAILLNTPGQPPPPPPTGLVAAYNFDQGSGTALTDVSGHGNNGTISNATWSTAGKYGGALSFNGTSSWVTVNDSPSLDLSNGMTLEAWVKPTDLSNYSAVLLKEQPGNLSYALYASDGSATGTPPYGQVTTASAGSPYAEANTGLPLNAWSFLAATYNGSTVDLYVNGSQVASVAATGNIVEPGGVLRIGGDSIWGEYFNGLIDNVRVYNTALSQSAIQTDMNTPVAASGAPLTASAGPSESGKEGGAVSFSGTASGGSGSLSYSWNFGDGTAPVTGTLTPTHTYTADGSYTATLTVTDTAGDKATSSTTAAVANVAPTASAGGPYNGTAGAALGFSGTASVPDPKDTLSYSWNFGDGSAAVTGTLTPSHTYATAGSYTATLTATDSEGLATKVTAAVTIQGSAPAGLVAAYNFNQGSGTTLTDVSGHGNNGTISNATWSTAGKYGGALSFNGTNSWVTIPDSPSLDLSSGMTLEAWVDPATLSGWRAILLKEQPNDLSYALYASDPTASGNPANAQVNAGGGDVTSEGSAGLPLNTWTFVAATYDGSTLRTYINGQLVASLAVTGNIMESGGVLRIGGDSVWGEYFKGLIDNVRIYNTALSQSSIQADMNTPV